MSDSDPHPAIAMQRIVDSLAAIRFDASFAGQLAFVRPEGLVRIGDVGEADVETLQSDVDAGRARVHIIRNTITREELRREAELAALNAAAEDPEPWVATLALIARFCGLAAEPLFLRYFLVMRRTVLAVGSSAEVNALWQAMEDVEPVALFDDCRYRAFNAKAVQEEDCRSILSLGSLDEALRSTDA